MKKRFLTFIYISLIIGVFLSALYVYTNLKNSVPETTSVKARTVTTLIPVGQPIGIYLKTQGVLVVDTGSFTTISGDKCSPSNELLYSGDYLTAIDGIAITDKKQIRQYIENAGGAEITFQVSRDDEIIQVKITPKKDENGTYKIGTWLRDSAQGIGTMTYIDSSNNFGALGHGINDIDTGDLLKLGTGLLYHTDIVAIKKGEKGSPGELTGVIEYIPSQVSGIIADNTSQGIYGTANDELLGEYIEAEPIPVALKSEVTTGYAQIFFNIGDGAKYYDIEITKISTSNATALNRQISIKITDEELISLTGGIVQGMSGAPIIQNGKFVGAITHVLVQDSTKGYGIFIEDMLYN